MIRSFKMRVFLSIVALAGAVFFFTPTASAAGMTVTTTVNSLRNATQAKTYLDNQCSSTSLLAAVAMYPSNIQFNTSNGVMTYTANLTWKKCANRGNTRALAITGYPSQGGLPATCPVAGTYHAGVGVNTYDCVKYTWGDAGHFGGYARLNCGPNYNYSCVVGGSGGYFRNGVEVQALQPSTSSSGRSYGGLSGTVPNWASVSQGNNSHTFGRAGAYCVWFKYNDDSTNPRHLGGQQGGGGCADLSITIAWTNPNYALTPTITSPDDNTVIETGRGPVLIRGNVANGGPTSSNPSQWQLTELRYSPSLPKSSIPRLGGGNSGSDPCAYFTGETNCDNIGSGSNVTYPTSGLTHTAPSNIGSYPIGTKICYALSVKNRSHNSTEWAHSSLHCFIIGKGPKVNVVGGNLFVGRTADNTPRASGVTARISTSMTINSTGTYGSWGEYAIAPEGPISGMASGSAYVGGDATHPNILSFVNTTNTSCPLAAGCYNHTAALPDIQSRFQTSTATPSINAALSSSGNSLSGVAKGLYRGSGSITIAASTIATGKWIVINAPTATVTISGNIAYPSGAIANAAQIPQLVIIANNIIINEGVTRVDSWLVAPGTSNGTTVTGGVIRTCNRPPSQLNIATCGQKLTVNGPVIANRLVMLRTAGSNPGTAAGDPAEVFNFRPDAYIWALQQAEASGRVTTVSSKELPPRY